MRYHILDSISSYKYGNLFGKINDEIRLVKDVKLITFLRNIARELKRPNHNCYGPSHTFLLSLTRPAFFGC